ncbi:MAG: bifunctional UDP-N-acetylglucosamine diphosphorylase/glucosamine-1-phosphate N-acetyltransferase GlmU [Chloroflexota bacterium]|nr:bifunctional UDP-N-acetylglucosamine diphosphorylase/glucosamine-1-phosphate N-acetyltransferase GlmU [Chloroflexota bacterium]
MDSYKAVILAAGMGTRMNSAIPKVLHKICGTEMLNIVLDTTFAAGLTSTVTVVPKENDLFKAAVKDKTTFAIQKEAKGSGHALLQSSSQTVDATNIIVLNGDVPLVKNTTILNLISRHDESGATVTVLTSRSISPDGLGRVVRNQYGSIEAIVEEKEAEADTLSINEINVGVYCFQVPWVWNALESLKPSSNGEFYITDLVALASAQELTIESIESKDPHEVRGVNNRIELSELELVVRERILRKWMLRGVTITDPRTTYIDHGVEIGRDTMVHPNSHIRKGSRIGSQCVIGPDTTIDNSILGDFCKINSSIVENARLHDKVEVGPFSRIREGTLLENEVHIGNYTEIKNSHLGKGTKSGHFSYLGDADIGTNVNIGAGTITCNYDGKDKHRTVIEDEAFIGCDTMLVAPVNIGRGALTGTGSVVTKDVPADCKAIGSPARILRGGRS